MKPIIKEAAIVLGIALLCATLCAFFHPKRPSWYQVLPDDVVRWQIDLEKAKQLVGEGSVLWVDARPLAKYEEAHYPGAICLDAGNLAESIFEQQDTLQNAMGHPVIVYCDGNRCEKSREVAKTLRELAGLDPVYLLKGNWRLMLSEDSK